MNVTEERLAALFAEWDRRYRENPDDFSEPDEGYGTACAAYLIQLNEELPA